MTRRTGSFWRQGRRCWLAVVLGLAALPAAATPVTVVVADAAGPLADAVVSLQPAAPVRQTSPAASVTATMDQVNSQFVPAVLAVQVGSLVRFPNRDQIRHQVYSFSPAKRFELPLYQGSTAKPVRFEQPGLVTVGCNIHDWMVGYVMVLDTPYFAVTGADAQVRLDVPPGAYELRVWHPRLSGASYSQPLQVARAPLRQAVLLSTHGPAPVVPEDPRIRALQDKFRRSQTAPTR
ncbi:methylamine utilization protein [Xanthomonas albilineans]|uniref:methylamine utilization protein n=1 Tax=Xanthomonas albilineans TaxID=29447 RepID=UPI000B128724|nr:methylamine utilization protein [Xanthomonas albilineans]